MNHQNGIEEKNSVARRGTSTIPQRRIWNHRRASADHAPIGQLDASGNKNRPNSAPASIECSCTGGTPVPRKLVGANAGSAKPWLITPNRNGDPIRGLSKPSMGYFLAIWEGK